MELVEVLRMPSGEIHLSRSGTEPLKMSKEIIERSPVLRNMMSPNDGEERTTVAFPEGYLSTWLEFVHGRYAADGLSRISLDTLLDILKVRLCALRSVFCLGFVSTSQSLTFTATCHRRMLNHCTPFRLPTSFHCGSRPGSPACACVRPDTGTRFGMRDEV
jgi:hypothetical protein